MGQSNPTSFPRRVGDTGTIGNRRTRHPRPPTRLKGSRADRSVREHRAGQQGRSYRLSHARTLTKTRATRRTTPRVPTAPEQMETPRNTVLASLGMKQPTKERDEILNLPQGHLDADEVLQHPTS